jgi:hypothetical protein
MDYIEELAKAKKALADKLAEEQRKQAKAGQEEQEAFQFLDRLRHFLVDNGSPGREEIEIEGDPQDPALPEVRLGWRVATLHVGNQDDEGDTVLVLFSDRTEVAEAEYFREFEPCRVHWNKSSSSGPIGSLSPKVIEGIAQFLETHQLNWDGR